MMYKTSGSGVPSQRLSALAAATTREQLVELARTQACTTVLRLVDVAPGANLHQYLREWKGACRTHQCDVVFVGHRDSCPFC